MRRSIATGRTNAYGWGLQPDLPTGLVMFGGEGSNVMFPIAERLGNSSEDLQLIMICGRNAKLKARLQRLKDAQPDLRRRLYQ